MKIIVILFTLAIVIIIAEVLDRMDKGGKFGKKEKGL
jgi:hypothetical protein